MSASLNWIAWNFEMGWPNCTRCPRVVDRQVEHGLGEAERQRGDRDAPDLERARGTGRAPSPGSPTRCSSGTHTSSKNSSRVSRPRQPMPRIFGPIVKPGVSFSTTKLAYVGRSPSADSVRASSVTPNDMSVPALEMNVLRPLISQPPSRRTARVRMPRASEPASGSVRPNAPSAAALGQRSQPALALRVVAEEVQRQRADGHVRLPRGGHRLVGEAELLHRGDEADGRHADAAPLLGDQHAEQAERAHLAEQVGRAHAPPPTRPAPGRRSPSARTRGRGRRGRVPTR